MKWVQQCEVGSGLISAEWKGGAGYATVRALLWHGEGL